MESQILVQELRQNDRSLVDTQGNITGTLEKYILEVTPKDILTVMRAVALQELDGQQAIGNKPSQIIVDNVSVGKRGINEAKRYIKMRFMDVEQLIRAATEAFRAVSTVTRIQMPARDSIVARRNFHLFVGTKDCGLLPSAISYLSPATLDQDSIVRIVGPIVPYGRKLFWNPVGTAPKMKFRQRTSGRTGRTSILKMSGASRFSPKFQPYASSTVKKLMRGKGANAQKIRALVGGNHIPGRTENAGKIVKRIMRSRSQYRGLHFGDGWVSYAPAIGWSKLRDPRVPAISIQFSRKGATNI